MKILAVDFSTSQRGVAVLDGPLFAVEKRAPDPGAIRLLVEENASLKPGLSALEMMDRVLAAAGVEREEIQGLAVGLGPGSYTGIRAAIAAAQGWQLANRVLTIGVSGADCLAAQFAGANQGRFWMVLDAQRDEFYLAGGETTTDGWRWHESLHIASKAEVEAKIKLGGTPIGPEVTGWFPAGKVMFPAAGTIGRLACLHGEPVSADRLEPVYLRAATFTKAPPPRQIPEA